MQERQRPDGKLGPRPMQKRVSRSISPRGVTASEIAAEDELEEGSSAELHYQRFGWFPRISLALSAFILSLVVTVISAYYALQGAEILVRPPEQVLLYRDGEGPQSILGLGIRLDMINAASDYGDVMLEAELSPRNAGVSFSFQNVTRPVFTGAAASASDACELGSRCIGLPGLRLIEQPDALVDLAGGTARAMHLSFAATQWNCEGPEQACGRFATFDRAAATLATHPLDLSLRLNFHRDGERVLRCTGGRIDLPYLQKLGWITVACRRSDVTGEPWL